MTIGTVAQIVKAVRAIDYQTDYRFDKIESVAFDTRRLTPNSLFVPLKGQTDGHDYIEQAIQQGAIAVFWGREDLQPPEGICAIWVDDPLLAFQDLAKWYVQQVSPIVVGITGSSGKTTTKDMTATVLASRYRVHQTQGNFNNEIGVPQTILDMPYDTQILVLEMGMNHFHEIEFLSQLATPDIAVITLIGESHIEYLGSRQGIAQAKLEILEGLKENGFFVYPANEPLLSEGMKRIQAGKSFTAKSVGNGEGTSLKATHIELFADHTSFFLENEGVTVTLPVLGAYNVTNALLALEVGLLCEVPLTAAIQALATFKLTKNRTEWVEGIHQSKILNDAYNASPIAMKAVISSFVTIPNKARRILVLGDIRELGEHSEQLHASIAEVIHPNEIHQLYLYGKEMKALYQVLQQKFPTERLHHYETDKAALIADLKQNIQEEDVVLVKSSNGTGLLEVVEALKKT